MHPVLRRILFHGGLTAGVLAVVGVLFAELASVWLVGNAPRNADPTADARVGAAIRSRVPLALAVWGFLFVLVGEVVIWRVRRHRPAEPKPAADETEKRLNELLAQAEAEAAERAGATPPAAGTPAAAPPVS